MADKEINDQGIAVLDSILQVNFDGLDPNLDIRARMELFTDITAKLEAKCLRCYDHVCRMKESRWLKTLLEWDRTEA